MYLAISLVVLFVSVVLFRDAAGTLSIRKPNMISYVFYLMLFMAFIGSIEVLYDLVPEEYVRRDDDLRFNGWLGVMYTMIALPVGMMAASRFFKIRSMRSLIAAYQSKRLAAQDSPAQDAALLHSLYIVSIACGLASAYFIFLQGATVPLWSLLNGDTDYYNLLRLRRVSGRLEGAWLLENSLVAATGFVPVLAYAAFGYWRISRNRADLIWFVSTSSISILIATYSLVKAPVIFFLVGMYLLHSMKSGKIAISKVLVYFLYMLCAIFILIFFFQGGLRGTGTAISAMQLVRASFDAFSSRVLFGQIVGYFMCLDYFPQTYPHLWFSSTGRLIHQWLGLPFQSDYGIIVMSLFRPEWTAAGIAGHATTMFMGEAWANFGLLGLVIGPLWVGFFIQAFHIFFLRLQKTPLNLAIYVQFSLLLPITSGIMPFYYPLWIAQYGIEIFALLAFARIVRGIGGGNTHGKWLGKTPPLPA